MRSRMLVTGKDDLALTALVRGGVSGDGLDVFVHAGAYEPPVFGEIGARVAVAGRGRTAAAAKYAPWARCVCVDDDEGLSLLSSFPCKAGFFLSVNLSFSL
jgi:hypothetical protein